MSKGFFDCILNDVLSLSNEEFNKLRIKNIIKEDLFLFFDDACVGVSITVKLSESRKKILETRLVKIANEIQEIHSIPGFMLRVE